MRVFHKITSRLEEYTKNKEKMIEIFDKNRYNKLDIYFCFEEDRVCLSLLFEQWEGDYNNEL